MGLAPRFSVRFGPLIVVVAGFGVIAAIAARLSGQRLAETIPPPEAHVQAGNLLPLGAAVYFILVLALWLLDRRGRRTLGAQVLAVLVIVAALLLTGWVALAGHTGAQSVWQGIAQQLGTA